MRPVIGAGMAVALLAAAAAHAEAPRSLDTVKQKLGEIEQNIQRLHETNRKRELVITDAGKKLKRLDRQLTTLSAELSRLKNAVGASEKKRASLQSRERRLSQRLDAQRRLMAEQFRSLQRHGHQARAATLFGVDSMGAWLRNRAYFDYYLRARQAQVADLTAQAKELHQVHTELERETRRLSKLKQAVENKRKQLASSQRQQKRALAALTRQQSRDREKVRQLARNRRALQKLMEKLRYQAEHASISKDTGFGRLKGKLGWPAKGKVRKSRLPGVTILTAANAPVHAVAGGRVVFADRMRGFGRLVIIDHGGGYMTLYGQNRRLSVSEGETIAPGAVIATSGDANADGIYFGIRHKAAPVDPRQWCRD